MKKTLVLALVAAMLVSMLAIGASAYTQRPLMSGKINVNVYQIATEWACDGVIDTANGEYFAIEDCIPGYTPENYLTIGCTGDANQAASSGALAKAEYNRGQVQYYFSGDDTYFYIALKAKPIEFKQTLYGNYNGEAGAPGFGDDFCCNLAMLMITGMDIDKSQPTGFKWDDGRDQVNLFYFAIAKEWDNGPSTEACDGLMAGYYDKQRGPDNKYEPTPAVDYNVFYNAEEQTVTYEWRCPRHTAFGNSAKCYFNLALLDGNDDYAPDWGNGGHYIVCLGDYSFFLDGSGGKCACANFVSGQPEGWTAAGDEPTDDTTAADDTTAEDTTAEETTAAPQPINPVTADITVLCLAAAASAIAVISKKRK